MKHDIYTVIPIVYITTSRMKRSSHEAAVKCLLDEAGVKAGNNNDNNHDNTNNA